MYLMHFLSFYTVKTIYVTDGFCEITLRSDVDVLTSLPVSHAILPRAVCFATSRPANHAICSFIDSVNIHLSQSEDVYF